MEEASVFKGCGHECIPRPKLYSHKSDAGPNGIEMRDLILGFKAKREFQSETSTTNNELGKEREKRIRHAMIRLQKPKRGPFNDAVNEGRPELLS